MTWYPALLETMGPVVLEPVLRAPYLSTLRWLREFDRLPAGQRAAWQRERLAEMLDFAAREVPFYRQLAAGRTLTLDDLPAVDKDRLRDDAAFLAPDRDRFPHIVKRTGGTTGDPWQYPLDKLAWSHMYAAKMRFWEQSGWRYGEKVVLLGAPPSLVPGGQGWKARLRATVERNVVSVTGTDVDPATSLARAQQAVGARAALWYGYAGTVAAMAQAVVESGVAMRGPKAICTSSETLNPVWRKAVEDAFGAQVLDQYGCNDGGLMSQRCKAGRFHVAENLSIVEVLDDEGRPCPPGVEGDVAVTNLHTRVMPFLRYRIGDRAVLADGPCSCGREGAAFESFEGRTWDRLLLPDGRQIAPLAFYPAFLTADRIRRWQVVQRGTSVRVRLDVQDGFQAAEKARIAAYFRDVCGPALTVDVTTAEPLEITAGGKLRAVVRQS